MTTSSILLTWNQLAGVSATGNSPITVYKIYWDKGDSSAFEYKISTLATLNTTITNLIKNKTYEFKILA